MRESGERAMRTVRLPTLLVLAATGLVVLAGCATVRTRDTLGPERDWEYLIRVQPRVGAEDLETGELRYRGRAVPTVFSELILFGQRYEYRYRTERDTFQGYHRDEEFEPAEITESGPELTRRDRNRGWYLAEFDERRPGTPSGWIWVRRENLSAYLDPREIREFADYYGLVELAGRTRAERDRRSNVQFTFSVHQSVGR